MIPSDRVVNVWGFFAIMNVCRFFWMKNVPSVIIDETENQAVKKY